MHFLLIIVLVVAAVIALNTGVSFPSLNLSTPQLTTSSAPELSSLEKDLAPTSFTLDTQITGGPENNSTVTGERVTFTFKGTTHPEQSGTMRFETRVDGLESEWQATSGTTRTIDLPGGPTEYTFQVRSVFNGYRDTTPASRIFRSNTSPFFENIEFSSVRTKTQPFSLELTSRLASGETLNITGWQLKSSFSGSIPIGQGVERFHPTSNTSPKNIVVKQGDRIKVSGTQGPLGRGVSFRPNACFGYLRAFYTFPISVPTSCPDTPKQEQLEFLSPLCQQFILDNIKTSSCSIPESQGPGSECASFIQSRWNYNACYELHKTEQNFDKSEWHIYEPRSFGNSSHDIIQLLDANGLLVDQYVY